MNFSSILDISSFFIGIIINLLFVALMCYYFKNKYDNLELAQNEQAKILYELLQKERRNCGILPTQMCFPPFTNTVKSNLEINQIDDSDNDSESESDSESECGSDCDKDEFKEKNELNEIKDISIQEVVSVPEEIIVTKLESKNETESKHDDYSKMTMKQLKDILSNNGIKTKPNMKKEDLIDLVIKKDLPAVSPSIEPMEHTFEIDGIEDM
jgi:hypothetical protein